MGLNMTPHTWTTGETVSALPLRAETTESFAAMQAPWDTYTPTWTDPGGIGVPNGMVTGRWLRYGKTVWFDITATEGSLVGTTDYVFTLPVPALSGAIEALGSGMFFDASAATEYAARAVKASTTTVKLLLCSSTTGAYVGAGVPVGAAVNDVITVHGQYQAA